MVVDASLCVISLDITNKRPADRGGGGGGGLVHETTYTPPAHVGGHHLLQLALVVFFLPITGANTLLALRCGIYKQTKSPEIAAG